MGFLCPHHRETITSDSDQAEISWQKTMHAGRRSVTEMTWDKAVMFYGNALEISEILLRKLPGKRSQERYVRASVELMHAMRNSQYHQDSLALFQMILNRLDREDLAKSTKKTLKPLKDVTFEPLEKVNHWMSQWHAMVSQEVVTVH